MFSLKTEAFLYFGWLRQVHGGGKDYLRHPGKGVFEYTHVCVYIYIYIVTSVYAYI